MIYYVGSYVDSKNESEYKGAVPARLKMDYVLKTLDEMEQSVRVFSLCSYVGKKWYSRKKVEQVSKNCAVEYVCALSEQVAYGKYVNRWLKKIQFFLFLLLKVRKEDVLLIYHSYAYLAMVKRLHFFKKFKWIAEVEELYSYAWNKPSIREKEMNGLQLADGYMCVNDVIGGYFQQKGKKVVISHGAYVVPPIFERHEEDVINVVYAGTIEKYKKGAFTAVECSRYLDPNKRMHILGFGKEEVVEELKSRIATINAELGHVRVQYHGKKYGDELYAFLQNCDIGLSSNIMDSDFANHTFPSKAITYVANNLVVVTGYAEMFKTSGISKFLKYFYEYCPKEIAEVINSIDEMQLNINGREKILSLHASFREQLIDLLK